MDVLGIFSTADFMPHGHCYMWSPGVLWLHVVADTLITLAYATIPLGLIWLVRKRRDLTFSWMLLCFGTFILACGATHALEILTIWTPVYWLSGSVKVVTALASIGTAIFLLRLLPTLRALPSLSQLTTANLALEHEVELRADAERSLREGNEQLEARITERTAELKNTVALLRASEERLRAIVETAVDAIITIDARGTVDSLNPAAERMFGYRSEEIIGRNVNMLMPSPYREGHDSYLEAYMRTGVRRIIGIGREVEARRKDGSTFPIDLAISEMSIAGEVRFTGIIRDISQRKRQEQELRQVNEALRASEERYRTIVETAEEGIWVVDGQSRTTFANRRMADLLGCGIEELGNRPIWDFMDDEKQAMAARSPQRGVLGARETHEFRLRRYDGRPLWTLMSTSPLRDANGQDIGALTMVSDISELKRNEERLAQLNTELEHRVAARTEQLTAVNRELEAFSYSISHDLRAPLRSIDGFSRAVIDDCGPILDPGCLRHLERVCEAAKQMSDLIDGMLMLSRLARSEVRRELIDVSALAASVVEALRIADPGRQVEVRIAAHLRLRADAVLVRAVFENLIGNAWKFTRERTPGVIEVAHAADHGRGVIMVRDNGAGFNMAYADKLFVPFQRLHGVNEFPGTGIGLATVKRVLDRHAGRIWVEAEVGRGATFFIDFGGQRSPATMVLPD